MTFREKAMLDNPGMKDPTVICPSDLGYEEKYDCSDAICTECWDREMPGTESKTCTQCMDDIQMKQYTHLRSEFDKLRWTILGIHYFTVANDVYGSDTETANSIICKCIRLEGSRDRWRNIAIWFGTFTGAGIIIQMINAFI